MLKDKKLQEIIVPILFLVAFIVFTYVLFNYNLLVSEQRYLILVVIAFVGLLSVWGLQKTKGWVQITINVFLFLASVVLLLGSYYIYTTFDTLDRISTIEEENVIEDQPISSVPELSIDESDQSELAEKEPATEEDIDKALEDLAGKSTVSGTRADEVEDGESFNVLISGIDQYGSLNQVSRSDVNIIMTVNPTTRNILLTTIPRDSYVAIGGGGNWGYDKLTHSGIYGIGSTVATLENLFDINIHYYMRVNFSSLIDMVDVLGGIEVYSPVAFNSGPYSFHEGMNSMDGKKALAFARERYSLSQGDLSRGRNQERIIEGMIQKAISPAILINYPNVMAVVMDSVQTNMPRAKITELINMQLAEGGSWQTSSTEVSGTGTYGLPSYAMPGWNLYMYQLNDGSVEDVRTKIMRMMNE